MRKRVFLLALLALTIGWSACEKEGESSSTDTETGFDRKALIANWTDNIYLPALTRHMNNVEALSARVSEFTSSPSAEGLVAAQEALKKARLSWQEVNFLEVGPAESIAWRAASNIYPTDTAKLNAAVANGNWNLASVSNLNIGGFAALGYLLHGVAATPLEIVELYSKPNSSYPNFITDVVDGLVANAQTVQNEWTTDFAASFKEADGTDVGSALGQSINALSLYLERNLRDGKIGIPAGVRSLQIARPENVEALYAGYSLELALRSLAALEGFYYGTNTVNSEPVGLDDYILDINPELHEKIANQFTAVRTSIENLEEPYNESVAADNQAGINSFEEFQKLVVLLKVDLTSALGVSITYQDNDGD